MALVARIRGAYTRATRFFQRSIWEPLDGLSPRRARRYRAARVAYGTLQELVFGDALYVRAAALTYFTVLSLVPLLAFAFALLKGFGAYDVLVEKTIRPYLLNVLQGNEALRTAVEQILGFVDRTGVTSLGFIGLLTLLYAATRLLRNIEVALNEAWGIKSGREAIEQLRDYITIIVVTPLCLVGAAGLTTADQATTLLKAASESLGVTKLIDAALGLFGPLAVLFLGLLVLYKVMPYTRVRMGSAALGAVVGAVLWYAVLIAHVRFQVGVANYNALYSSFGAIPIFLAWLQLSWLVVLVGAQVAATHQNNRTLAQGRRTLEADRATEEAAGLSAALLIAQAFLRGDAPLSARVLAERIDVPEALLDSYLCKLIDAHLVARVEGEDEPAFVLARPATDIRVKDVIDAIRRAPRPGDDAQPIPDKGEDLARRLWQELDRAASESPANRPLAEVLAVEVQRASTAGAATDEKNSSVAASHGALRTSAH